MKDGISPEEKLLRLIRGQKKPRTLYPLDKAGSVERRITPAASSPKPSIKNASFLLDRYLTAATARKVIIALLAFSLIYLAASFAWPLVGLKKIVLPQASLNQAGALKFTPKEEPKPYEFYLDSIKQRQIFGGSVLQQARVPAPVATKADLIKEMSLVGIIAGDNPQAIIQDKTTEKTYYVIKGQFIGDIQIEDILEGKIIVNDKGKRYELYL